MILLPPRSTRTDTLVPYTTLFRSSAPNVADVDLVDFIQENDAILFCGGHGRARHVVLVQPLVLLFLDQLVPGVCKAHFAPLALGMAECLAHHVGQVEDRKSTRLNSSH